MGKIVAVTGVNSYFASTVLPKLAADPEVERIVGIDVTGWKGSIDKMDFHRVDVRSKEMFALLKGVDTLYHLAFIVGEIHDKEKTYDININGSKNVFTAAAEGKVRKVIYTSSATAYGARADNPLGIKEDRRLRPNEDSYYSLSKAEVESFVRGFFANHPDILLTVLRAGLCVGPHIDNLFSRFWSRRASIFLWGRHPHLQLIHEEDLGEALYLAMQKDLPGIYNVAADDAVATRWVFEKAGVKLVNLPGRFLKAASNVAFALRLEEVSQGWLSLCEHTIHVNSDKFKKAAGWEPAYSSETAYLHYLAHRDRSKPTSGSQPMMLAGKPK